VTLLMRRASIVACLSDSHVMSRIYCNHYPTATPAPGVGCLAAPWGHEPGSGRTGRGRKQGSTPLGVDHTNLGQFHHTPGAVSPLALGVDHTNLGQFHHTPNLGRFHHTPGAVSPLALAVMALTQLLRAQTNLGRLKQTWDGSNRPGWGPGNACAHGC